MTKSSSAPRSEFATPRRGWVYRIGGAGIFAVVATTILAGMVTTAWIVARPPSSELWFFTAVLVAEVMWGIWIPYRVTVFPDGEVEFRSLMRRRRVPARDIVSAEDVRGAGWALGRGIRFELRDRWPVGVRFPLRDQNDLLARLRELNPFLDEK
jgi:hypothetical protein